MRRLLPIVSVLALLAVGAASDARTARSSAAPAFELVGHDPLYSRGMNAAPAMYRHFLYIGSRTDGSPQHPHPGVLVVNVKDPANPRIVGEIGPPHEGLPTQTSRELRVWPQQKLLIVMNFSCSAIIHACTSPADAVGTINPSFNFFDLSNPAQPELVAQYVPSRTPHEMYLWVDPANPMRALMYITTPTSSTTRPNLIVTDISRAREGQFDEVVHWIGNDEFAEDFRSQYDVRLHSLALTANGRRAYLAYLGGGFLILDTSDLAAGVPEPQVRTVNTPGDPAWGNPGTHSSVKIPGRPYAFTTDEVYGDTLDPITGDNHGCPWGWVRVLDVRDQANPRVVSEFRTAENLPEYCGQSPAQQEAARQFFVCDITTGEGPRPTNTFFTSYSSHNPTVLRNVALVTWHSNGLQAIDLADPLSPSAAGVFSPQPLPFVFTEDPALSLGENKVVAWSYPIIRNGLIYFVDVRNGLYVVRYRGPHAQEVARIGFFEGNSNLADALRLGN